MCTIYETIVFLRTVDGTKQSQVEAKLMKDGKALPLKDVEVVVGEDKITYKIKKPQRELSGIYQIKIGNNQGEEVKDVNVVMQGSFRFISSLFHFASYFLTSSLVFSQMFRPRRSMSRSTRSSRIPASCPSSRRKTMVVHPS